MQALFEIMQAWNVLMYLGAGFTVAGLGAALAAFTLAIAWNARRYDGEIVAVRAEAKREMFWPVIAYADGQGARHEANANSGSNSIIANMPGRKVAVLVSRTLNDAVMLMRDWWMLLAVAAFMIACGVPFLYAGMSDLNFNTPTALVAVAAAAAMTWKFVNALRTATGNASRQAARDAFLTRRKAQAEMARLSIADIEAVAASQRKQNTSSAPLIALVGAAFLLSGVYWYQSDSAFAASASAAEGTVIGSEVKADSEGTLLHHAIVRFTDAAGNVVEHRDRTGTSPALYRQGDKVTILYAPADPARAMIDHGVWNKLWPTLVMLVGAALLAFGARTYAQSR